MATLKEPEQCILAGNGDLIKKVSWKPNSSVLLASSRNGIICMWDLKKQARAKRMFGDGSVVYFVTEPMDIFELELDENEETSSAVDIQWSDNGKTFAVGFDNGVIAVLGV